MKRETSARAITRACTERSDDSQIGRTRSLVLRQGRQDHQLSLLGVGRPIAERERDQGKPERGSRLGWVASTSATLIRRRSRTSFSASLSAVGEMKMLPAGI